jgi:hypothetical protein
MVFKLDMKLGPVENAQIRRIVQVGLLPQLGEANPEHHSIFSPVLLSIQLVG